MARAKFKRSYLHLGHRISVFELADGREVTSVKPLFDPVTAGTRRLRRTDEMDRSIGDKVHATQLGFLW